MGFDQTTELLTVGQLASQAGVRPDTIRYYERTGLLPAPQRTSGDQRRYEAAGDPVTEERVVDQPAVRRQRVRAR